MGVRGNFLLKAVGSKICLSVWQ